MIKNKLDGDYFSPDGGTFVVRNGVAFWEDGQVSNPFSFWECRYITSWCDVVDYSEYTPEQRRRVWNKAHPRSKYRLDDNGEKVLRGKNEDS